jgi:hypothetical protein
MLTIIVQGICYIKKCVLGLQVRWSWSWSLVLGPRFTSFIKYIIYTSSYLFLYHPFQGFYLYRPTSFRVFREFQGYLQGT